jgi:hypothetical protein
MRRLAAVALATVTLGLGACREDTVRFAYQPRPGDRYEYRVEVRAAAMARVGDEPPRRTEANDVFEARHSVLEAGPGASRVEVRLNQPGGQPRTFVVRLDRAAQLTEVQSIEGLPASALGGVGLSEIFPAAAAAPPDRPLAPDDRWSIDEPVQVATPEPSRLVGRGRLASLEVMDGREVATVDSTYRLPVRRIAQERFGQLHLVGSQDTRATTSYDLRDGAVVSVRSQTKGTYQVMLLPPPGTPGPPVPGDLVVEVTSVTRRRD